MDKSMSKATRKQLINKLRQGYVRMSKAEKTGVILSLVLATGYSRKAAIRVLNQPIESQVKSRKKRQRPSKYEGIMPLIRKLSISSYLSATSPWTDCWLLTASISHPWRGGKASKRGRTAGASRTPTWG